MSLNHSSRILAIDALRGVVILLMLVDHVREFFYLHLQVGDPMDITATAPELAATRLTAHICAPVFVFLSGLSAYLYGQKQASRRALSRYLLARGLFLVALEITVITFAWRFQIPPTMIFLQVIWVIGLSMITLSALIWLPMPVIIALGLVIVCGHNMLASMAFAHDSPWFIPWAILYDRSIIPLTDSISARTSYPLLPWIGVIALGYASGRLFGLSETDRRRILIVGGLAMLALFVILRATNLYGETQGWQAMESGLLSALSFLNLTKYPPSLLFLLATLGLAALILAWFEWLQAREPHWMRPLVTFGRAPLFFYVSHLYLIHLLYLMALETLGANQGERYGFESVSFIWLTAAALTPLLYALCRWFLDYKQAHREQRWLSYF